METHWAVTGANGFLGNVVCRELEAAGVGSGQLWALTYPEGRHPSLEGVDCTQTPCDVTDRDSVAQAIDLAADGADGLRVVHCAGVIDIGAKRNPLVEQVDVGGTRTVLDVVAGLGGRMAEPPRLVAVGSVHAIPEQPKGVTVTEPASFDPALVTGQYAKAKAAACALVEEAARSGVDACIVLPSGIVGPWDFSPESMKRLVWEVAHGRLPATVRGGYDFVDVRDVAHGIVAAAQEAPAGRSYILSNRYVAISDLCRTVARVAGVRPPAVVLPRWMARAFAPLCELWYRLRRRPPLFTSYALYTLGTNADFSHARATCELGYRPRPLEETLSDMLAWMRAQPGREGTGDQGAPA